MRIVTWNLNQRVGALPRQAAFLESFQADIFCLQEVTVRTAPMLRQTLAEFGFGFFVSTAEECLSGPRRYGLAIASRNSIERRELACTAIWPERILKIEGEFASVLTTHIPPGSSNGLIKVEMLESAFEEFQVASNGPAILSGDFNAPQEELPALVTWAQQRRRDGEWALIPSRGMRWDLAERQFFNGSVTDAFRYLHPQAEEWSWTMRRKEQRFPRRFDHIFCSDHWEPTAAQYGLEDRSLSDHRALVCDLVLK